MTRRTPHTISIVCTNKGRHDTWRIGWIAEPLAGSQDREPAGQGVEHVRGQDGWRTGYRLTCSVCGRAPVLREDTWRRLVTGLDDTRTHKLDVSLLPF